MLKTITARHFDLSNELKQRAEDEMEGLKRYFDHIISVELILDMEKHRRKAELKVKVYNQTLTSSADTDEFQSAIASAVDKIKGQLKKYKGKLKDKKPEQISDFIGELTRPDTDVDELEP